MVAAVRKFATWRSSLFEGCIITWPENRAEKLIKDSAELTVFDVKGRESLDNSTHQLRKNHQSIMKKKNTVSIANFNTNTPSVSSCERLPGGSAVFARRSDSYFCILSFLTNSDLQPETDWTGKNDFSNRKMVQKFLWRVHRRKPPKTSKCQINFKKDSTYIQLLTSRKSFEWYLFSGSLMSWISQSVNGSHYHSQENNLSLQFPSTLWNWETQEIWFSQNIGILGNKRYAVTFFENNDTAAKMGMGVMPQATDSTNRTRLEFCCVN